MALDKETLEARFRHKEEKVRRFLGLFLAEIDGYQDNIVAAAGNGNMDDLRLHAHSLKGASANLSAMAINATSAKLEAMAKAEPSSDDVDAEVDRLQQQIVDFKATVSDWYGIS